MVALRPSHSMRSGLFWPEELATGSMIAPSPKTSLALMMRLLVAIADALKMRVARRGEPTEFSLESEILPTAPCNEGLRRCMRPPSTQGIPKRIGAHVGNNSRKEYCSVAETPCR